MGSTNSMPASSPSCARRMLFSQVFCQRSSTFVTAMPLEQFGEKNPSFRALPPTMLDCLCPMVCSLEAAFDVDAVPARRLVRHFVAAAERGEVEALNARALVRDVAHVDADLPVIVGAAPADAEIDHRVGVELVGTEVTQVVEEAVGVSDVAAHVQQAAEARPLVADEGASLQLGCIRRLHVPR